MKETAENGASSNGSVSGRCFSPFVHLFVPDFHPVDGKGRVQPVCASLPCVPANPDRCYLLLQDYEPVRWLVESFHGLVVVRSDKLVCKFSFFPRLTWRTPAREK